MSIHPILTFCFLILSVLILPMNLVSCSGRNNTVTIWTDRPEFAIYAEIYNSTHEDKVLAVYKDNLSGILSLMDDEKLPDLVAGSWLESTNIKKYFLPVDYLLKEKSLDPSMFYSGLMKLGYKDEKQYLLPVSFNLPCIVFLASNNELVKDKYVITMDEMKELGKEYNKKNKSGIYTKMGFGPSWNPEFIYVATKLFGSHFSEQEGHIIWDKDALNESIEYIRQWTTDANTSTTAEEDFQFKYLYTPALKWITEKNTLFAYSTSDRLFALAPEKISDMDFRWLTQDGRVPPRDEVVSIGMYKKSHNLKKAENFLLWFFNEENQKLIMESVKNMNLVSSSFGIAGGFSSIKSVNQSVFPGFYPSLMGNMPHEENLDDFYVLPSKWLSLKERAVKVFLKDATNTVHENPSQTLEQLIDDWKKQYY